MNTAPNPSLHKYAVFTAICTFLLLIAGALVTSNDAGLSVPTWPLAWGTVTPPMVGGIVYEWSHRVIAATIGFLTIILAVWLWMAEKRPWMRWMGFAALSGVIAQGILGGMTVRMFQPPPVSAAHATLAQLFFSTVVAIAFFTGSWWQSDIAEVEDEGNPPVRSLTVWTVAAVFLQLILGAAFRHKGFGIFPHLIGAVIVTILVFKTAAALKRRFADTPPLRKCANVLHILIGVQLLLGAGAWWSRIYSARFPQPIPVMVVFTVVHTVTGALLLATTLLTALVTHRMIRPGTAVAEPSASPQQVAQ